MEKQIRSQYTNDSGKEGQGHFIESAPSFRGTQSG